MFENIPKDFLQFQKVISEARIDEIQEYLDTPQKVDGIFKNFSKGLKNDPETTNKIFGALTNRQITSKRVSNFLQSGKTDRQVIEKKEQMMGQVAGEAEVFGAFSTGCILSQFGDDRPLTGCAGRSQEQGPEF